MKVILSILCAIVVLFAGGCSLIVIASSNASGLMQSFPFSLILGGIALLNVLVLMGLFRRGPPQRWAFFLLGAIDLLIAAIIAAFWVGIGLTDPNTNIMAMFWIGIVLLKGLLTLLYARKL